MTKKQIRTELKIDTLNFMDEVKGFIYYDEKEFEIALEILNEKYKFVDYYSIDSNCGLCYHIYASNFFEYDAWEEDNKNIK
jgi:hypothetical protein